MKNPMLDALLKDDANWTSITSSDISNSFNHCEWLSAGFSDKYLEGVLQDMISACC